MNCKLNKVFLARKVKPNKIMLYYTKSISNDIAILFESLQEMNEDFYILLELLPTCIHLKSICFLLKEGVNLSAGSVRLDTGVSLLLQKTLEIPSFLVVSCLHQQKKKIDSQYRFLVPAVMNVQHREK